ncbi:MAG: ribosome hibernation-promoting factor, HPF/YfiA family [Gemmatimonadota bacterium]
MRIQIVARHCDIPEAVRTRTEEQIPRLSRFDPRLSSAEVIFTEEKRERRVEVILSVNGGPPVVARASGDDFRSALDRVWDRAAKILRRSRDQLKDHKAPKPAEQLITE